MERTTGPRSCHAMNLNPRDGVRKPNMSSSSQSEAGLEKLASRIAVPAHVEHDFKATLKQFYQNAHVTSPFTFEGYEVGGSFERGVYINKQLSMDVFFFVKESALDKAGVYDARVPNLGRMLFANLNRVLRHLALDSNVDVDSTSPVRSIKATIRRKYHFYCIPAVKKKGNPVLVIPDGNESKRVNPVAEEQQLASMDKKTGGMATALVRLIKCWNVAWDRPMSNHLIERLVATVFGEKGIKSLVRGLRTFFQDAMVIVSKQKTIPELAEPERSILQAYPKERIAKIKKNLSQAFQDAVMEHWDVLFKDYWK
ncbi:MAG: hypothetical protein ACFFCS_28805 [Candidatus Hodarchaeota archaeon]